MLLLSDRGIELKMESRARMYARRPRFLNGDQGCTLGVLRWKVEEWSFMTHEVSVGNMRKNKFWDLHCANIAGGTGLVGRTIS